MRGVKAGKYSILLFDNFRLNKNIDALFPNGKTYLVLKVYPYVGDLIFFSLI